MAESGGSTEFDFAKVLEYAERDTNGPAARTSKVYQYLSDSGRFTNWDLICFCTEYLASQVGSMSWLEPPVRWLVRLVYMAHYIRFETVSWQDKQPISALGSETGTESAGESTTGP